MHKKKSLCNISKNSFISRDYLMALGSVINFIESVENNEPSRVRHLARRGFLHREIPRYEVYFSSKRYDNVVNDLNKDSVAKINSIVRTINAYRVDGILEFDLIKQLLLKIIKLID